MSEIILDCTLVETRRNTKGYELRCPACGGWYVELLTTTGGGTMCRGCWRKLGVDKR